MMWQPTLPDDPVVAGWWRASEEKARREAVLADARRRARVDRLRRRVDEVNRQLDAVAAAAEMRAARRAAIERRGEWWYDDDTWWRPGPHGIEVAGKRSFRPGELEYSHHRGRVLNIR
jgi:hypothetical protein